MVQWHLVASYSQEFSEDSEDPTGPQHSTSECAEGSMRADAEIYGNDHYGQSGNILSRTSTSSMLFRKWQDAFWVHLYPATLLLFRTAADFDSWAHRGERRKVMLRVDFDTFGILAGRGVQKGLNSNNPAGRSSKSSTKLMSMLQKYSLGDVQTNFSGRTALFTFKLECFSNVGVDVVANFASPNPEDLRILRRVIHDCIQMTERPKKGAQRKTSLVKRNIRRVGEEEITHSTEIATEVTYESGRHRRASG